MPVPVRDEVIHEHHRLHVLLPSESGAETVARLSLKVVPIVKPRKRRLAFSLLAERSRLGEPGHVFFPTNAHQGVDKHVGNMAHAQNVHQARRDYLVDALVPIYAPVAVITRKLVVRGICADACPRGIIGPDRNADRHGGNNPGILQSLLY